MILSCSSGLVAGNNGSMNSLMRRVVAFLLVLLSLPSLAVGAWSFSAAEWARPRHGEWLVRQPALVAMVEQMQQLPGSRIELRYPGGDEGILWAGELQSWLVALGIASNRIEVVPGSGAADRIDLRLIENN